MNVLLENAFDRLLSRYQRTFGEPPPFSSATADEVIAHMRRRLAEDAGAPPAWLTGAAQAARPGAGLRR